MTKIISVLTATRAEYGLLKPIITRLKQINEFDVRIVCTGAHLSPEFGLTYHEILSDGFAIDKKIEILLSSDTSSSISKTMGLALISFADYFEDLKPDLLILLGDRFETLSVAIVAMNQRIPIAHLYGGETTEGAIDEVVRHALTKLSYIHFTSTEEHRMRVIQLGEQPDRVYNIGAIGIENIHNEKLLEKSDLELELGLDLSKPYAMVTFHPVTLEGQSSGEQIVVLLNVCKEFTDLNFIFTKANADTEGRIINQLINDFSNESDNIKFFSSLGMNKYLSMLKYSTCVIGNSSSGLIEAPSFGIPTVNIGDRQKGRLQSNSVINCESSKESIIRALNLALSDEFLEIARKSINPYGCGDTSNKFVEIVKSYLFENSIDLKKQFYNCCSL